MTAQLPALDRIRASLAADSLRDFIREAWPVIEPTRKLEWNWHLDVLCEVLECVTRGEIKRLIINVPPGTGKSVFSVLWNAWTWVKYPERRFLTFSYTADNTIRDNLNLRNVITSDWYQSHYPHVKLSGDQSAKIRFNTTSTGYRIASSVGGVGTGEHPDYIVIDDPLKAADATSIAALKTCVDWYDRTIPTRISLDPGIVIIMQRLHEDDLSGHLLSKGGWHHLCLPMRYSPTETDPESGQIIWQADPRDIREVSGQLLWPSLWTEERVAQEEIDLGPFSASGQLGQRPVPEGGGLFKREDFIPVDAVPVGASRARGWDTADTDITAKNAKRSDWTVGVKIAYHEGFIYIEDAIRRKMDPGAVHKLIVQTAIIDGVRCAVREGSGSGKATILSRSKALIGYDYAASPETESKILRADAFRAQVQAGNVRIVRGEWNAPYLSVVCSFPFGKWDDDIDATANAFNALVEKLHGARAGTWGRGK